MDVDAALEYAQRHTLHALRIEQDGAVVFERYGAGADAGSPHLLYSGTKSFWGPLAVALQDEGLLLFDEPVCETIPAWATDPWKRRITLRQLLTMTSGIGFGGLGNAVPTYAQSLETVIKAEPGTRFTYSGISFQVFGAVLAAKLAGRGVSPHAYLRERLLDPIGVRIAAWRSLKDGTQPLPTGASLSATEWAKYGAFLLSERARFAACFEGTAVNPHYGLGIWLRPVDDPPDIVHASGSGGQALYIVPSERTVIVHFGKSASYRHEAFLRRLFKRATK